MTAENGRDILMGQDLVVDCTDNYETRYLIDDLCGELSLPMMYGTAEQMDGQVSLFHTKTAGSYRALYPQPMSSKEAVGVFPPMVGLIGSLQALETLQWLTTGHSAVEGVLLVVDGRTLQFNRFEIGG